MIQVANLTIAFLDGGLFKMLCYKVGPEVHAISHGDDKRDEIGSNFIGGDQDIMNGY